MYEERADTFFVCERRRSRRIAGRAMREQLRPVISCPSDGSKRYEIGWISCGVRPLP